MKPLKIRALLRCGVVSDSYLPLDGILFYQAHRYLNGPLEAAIPGATGSARLKPHELPLEVVSPGKEYWYYRCSWAQWSHDVEGQDYWNKRFDSSFERLLDFGGRRGRVATEKGKYKAYHMPIFYRSALWIEWFCVGDETAIRELLLTVTHIGKKSSQGWGRVSQWEIEAVGCDWSINREGRLMRGIPLTEARALAVEFRPMHSGIRPSYWDRTNQMMLGMPN